MPTAEQYTQYQTLRLAVGGLFVGMWIHFLIVYLNDDEALGLFVNRLWFKIFIVWLWNLFEFSVRSYLIKTRSTDIQIHHVLMLTTLPIVWFFDCILDLCLFLSLFHKSILIYLSLFRLYQHYKKDIPAFMHWLGSVITFLRLCISFYGIYYYFEHYAFNLSAECLLAMILITKNILFDLWWTRLVIRRSIAFGFSMKKHHH